MFPVGSVQTTSPIPAPPLALNQSSKAQSSKVLPQPYDSAAQRQLFFSRVPDSSRRVVLGQQRYHAASRKKRDVVAIPSPTPVSTRSTGSSSSTDSSNAQTLQTDSSLNNNATSIAQTIESPATPHIGMRHPHHENPMLQVRHTLHRYFDAMPTEQRKQLLKDPGVIVNRLYTDLQKKNGFHAILFHFI
jgi:hypothetical protein